MDYQGIILDLMNRVIKLEKEVEALKSAKETTSVVQHIQEPEIIKPIVNNRLETGRDKTRYMFKGNVYLKNKLVLAVVTDYVNEHPNITINELKEVFNKSLQGSIGVVEKLIIAVDRKDFEVRFFAKDNEVLNLVDGKAFVCSQWGILNIPNFLARARQLGYEIEEI